MFIAVDLPEPLGPMMATNSPAVMSRSMPFSASSSAAPLPYTLVTPRRRISGVPAATAGVRAGASPSGVLAAPPAPVAMNAVRGSTALISLQPTSGR